MVISTAADERIKTLESRLQRMEQVITAISGWPEPWIDMKRAARLKGINYGTLLKRPWLRPKGGEPDAILNGRCHWRPETIREWIMLADDELVRRYKGENE